MKSPTSTRVDLTPLLLMNRTFAAHLVTVNSLVVPVPFVVFFIKVEDPLRLMSKHLGYYLNSPLREHV